jgi:hypothetical protein
LFQGAACDARPKARSRADINEALSTAAGEKRLAKSQNGEPRKSDPGRRSTVGRALAEGGILAHEDDGGGACACRNPFFFTGGERAARPDRALAGARDASEMFYYRYLSLTGTELRRARAVNTVRPARFRMPARIDRGGWNKLSGLKRRKA